MKKQAGVTLIISILIMSAVALASVAVAAFALSEIRSSRAVALTEPAISASETAGEQGLWAIKRDVSLTNCNSGQTTVSLSNGAIVNSCKTYSKATINLKGGVPFVFFLYDPNDPNGNLCMNQTYDSGQHSGCAGAAIYTSITIVHKAGTSDVSVTTRDLNGNAFAGSDITVTRNSTGTVTIPDPIPATPPTNDERLKVTLSSNTDTTIELNALPLGLPNYPTVSAGGCAAKTALSDCTSGAEIFNRRLNITVPQ